MAFPNINGRSVAYPLLGADSNPLVMLMHPLGMSQAVWGEFLPVLPRYHVLTWDLPSHGASQAWGEGPIAPTDLAAEALTAECDGAPLEILNGVGHLPSVKVPGRFAEKLLTLPLE